ncbi:hypothetical protein HRR83_007973 [Exophiala dermatitidis]|uniref:Uncharacterized protein n=1 Tax=Exophiala dermatitidis TaxID=5970 RepID=A0AAN6EST6_EXODE|nr:hypothetical protein HRR75_008628 [Exophiala dermatitidis]KAJ4502719.1 hypothetical protein HRR73_009373 [Exophiala dermatitidis]KAJ4503257.1 hypothetical protein HRR74_009381 [Exophiala dermatitidis]KAJ4535826.1 hypothetical protein HRR77_007767 [Exophiala dermatitidis]KAJ4541925.1 hypothetical protein HRR78_007203 [Exophiala dermatitidis]
MTDTDPPNHGSHSRFLPHGTPWVVVRYRRLLWIVGTIVIVVVATTAITAGVVWRLTLLR